MDNLDQHISEVKNKIDDVKKRWPFHSVQPSLVQELEELESLLEELQAKKKSWLSPDPSD
ncbi:MAG: hypothetical protein HGA27_03950 [Peptococcaceae bacterium]|nr:hypothetical protein [Peptococcaceae bacterium]